MSDEENITSDQEQNTTEIENTEISNKRKHDGLDGGDNGNPKKKKFVLLDIQVKNKEWELPSELADFLQERCQNYLGEKELEEFVETTTPKNVKVPIKLDPFMKALLEKKGLNKTVSMKNSRRYMLDSSRSWDLCQQRGTVSKQWWDRKMVMNQILMPY